MPRLGRDHLAVVVAVATAFVAHALHDLYANPIDTESAIRGAITIFIPLVAASYLAFSTTTQRVFEADQHVREVDKLHVSAIETLAMAIDAKDQLTLGHIRRVQLGAVRLADTVGVRHEGLRRAIETAALLHDTGKLAVPEYILNKPGRLSPSEYEVMKLHASIGADMLSAIEFAYPVVPIVRHHHENWDGTGYPSGLAGTDIPIGARILAVADCFDALTSDRPYRGKMSKGEAIAMIRARRGTMYDPVVVDALVRLHGEPAADTEPAQEMFEGLRELTGLVGAPRSRAAARPRASSRPVNVSTEELILFYELGRVLGSARTFREVAQTSHQLVSEAIPAALFVLHLHEEEAGMLRTAYVSSPSAAGLLGSRVPVGSGMRGWVGAYRSPLRSASSSVTGSDFGSSAAPAGFSLEHCLAVPLATDDRLVGVLSLYAGDGRTFTGDHERLAQIAARIITPHAERTAPVDSTERESGAYVPSVRVPGTPGWPKAPHRAGAPTSIVLVSIDDVLDDVLEEVADLATGDRDPALAADRGIGRALDVVRMTLRASDAIFPYSERELLVLLPATEPLQARGVARRIEKCLSVPGLRRRFQCGVASSPADGESLQTLIGVAQRSPDRRGLAETRA